MSYQITSQKYLLPKELAATHTAIDKANERDSILLDVALSTGGRRDEILEALNSKTALQSDDSLFLRGLKGSLDRSIPLKPQLAARIRSLKKNHPEAFKISSRRFNAIWDYHRPVPKKLHALRHTFAVELYRKTKDIRLVQVALGHQNINNTMVYMQVAVSTEDLQKALL